ncbi:LTA synthase family protein [Lysinibacillus xylanilyticus]|uniref:LTA synthase family protein n=1 Tax=Lysinibacillus xylanilyticus TaxID=582475 RepID=UPI0038070670
MRKKYLLMGFFYFIAPILGVYLIEVSTRNSFELTNLWINENLQIFIVSSLIFLLIQSLIVSLTNNIYISIVLSYTLFYFLVQINTYKIQILDNPLLPWDIFFVNQVLDLAPVIYKKINISFTVFIILLVIVVLFLLVKYTRFSLMNVTQRVLLFCISTFLVVLIVNYPNNYFQKIFDASEAKLMSWDQKATQNKNGLILGIILNMPSVIIDKPNNYSKAKVDNYVQKIQKENGNIVSDIKPNIVIVMSEAFWELNNLGIGYNSTSLTPTVDKFKKGELVSPTFGGGTANTEFEVLTGFSMNHLPGGSIPYQQYISKDTPSLASLLGEQGYNTAAIHTYFKYFWNRNEVYSHLGFDKFIGLEDLNEQKYFGTYIDDAVVNELIINEIRENKESTFIYAVTMQNHGLYSDTRYGEKTLNITNSYSNETNQIINTYGTGTNYSDNELKVLMQQLEELKEPTLVVFFGDHLPALGEVYDELGYIKDMDNKTLEEELKMKQTPLVVWNNYGKQISNLNSISSSFLPSKIIEWAELKSPLYFNFLNDFYNEIPGYTSLVKVNNDGSLSLEIPESKKSLEEMYQTLQYDMMFGDRYSKNVLFKID